MKKIGFLKGLGQVQEKDSANIRTELMIALGVASKMSLSTYSRGLIEPKVGQANAVEAVFNKYNITEIWDK
jgi:hypothetical protein